MKPLVDLVALTEACYRLDLDLRAWLRLVGRLVAPELDHGFGVVALLMRFHSELQAEPVGPVEVIDGHAELGPRTRAINTGTQPEAVRVLWLTGQGLKSVSERLRAMPAALVPISTHRGDLPVTDAVGVSALDGEGFAVSFAGPTSHLTSTTPADRVRWNALGPHLAAGFRLRRRLTNPLIEEGAEAIFSPDGRCLDAHGPATGAGALELLRTAVRAVERSRGPLRRKNPEEALKLWRGLVTGRWSLVDSFTTDGKRYVVARINAPFRPDPRALNQRERQVVSFAAAGESNKVIAYRLGLATSTIGTHLASASRKLGLRRRSELARLHAINTNAAEVRRLDLAGEPLRALVLPSDGTRLDQAQLTPAECDVAQLLLGGASNAEIANHRKTSARTVANQVAALFGKLKVGSRSELVALLSRAPRAT